MTQMQHLVAFVRTAEHGSFSAAARILGLTPAGVSKSVASLEADLGVRLFHRSTRHLALTESGALLAMRTRSIPDNHYFGGLDERGRGLPLGETHFASGVGGDDRRDALAADQQLHLREQPAVAHFDNAAD